MISRVACFVVICLLATSKSADGVIGLNWGRVSAQRLIPSMVVDLMLQNSVQHARVYTSQTDILQAFCGSGINLTIGKFNIYEIQNDFTAKNWVQAKLQYFAPANIRRIYVGNYAFKYGFHDQSLRNAAINTLYYMQRALNTAGYGDRIKVTLPHTVIVLKGNITRPSEAEFRGEIMADMKRVLAILQENKAPFVVEIFPALYVYENKMDPSFAFSDNKSTLVVTDVNGAVYTNVFDFVYDAFVWALEKAGAGDLEIVVGQVGWPTDGYPGANAEFAERFFKSLLPMIASNKGTPKRPGRPIDVFVHSLADESRMPDNEPHTRHWGIYRSNGEPKYKIDLTGQGRDIFPARAKGIMRMPDRWCVLKNETNDFQARLANKLADEKCGKEADCTSLAPGGSCSHLSYKESISYKFNMYFQSMFQNEDSCDFESYGQVVVDNPSTRECVFPVEVVRGHQFEFDSERRYSDGNRVHRMPGCAIFTLLLSIVWGLV